MNTTVRSALGTHLWPDRKSARHPRHADCHRDHLSLDRRPEVRALRGGQHHALRGQQPGDVVLLRAAGSVRASPDHEGELRLAERGWQAANHTYAFSRGLGTVELMIGLLVLVGLASRRLGLAGAVLAFLTPFVTLSFLVTTPEAWVPALGTRSTASPTSRVPAASSSRMSPCSRGPGSSSLIALAQCSSRRQHPQHALRPSPRHQGLTDRTIV